ncbi:DUF397 domain-containing protein [Actinobacteria bacterium YIM 96077]|uniref:DUF397 domain-containing protein n=1 Tax=Phytoactinopolyspora halophila TaxID=1981511 RepID=A0A329QJE7_9ACTN|nr:DUF397 domain-containing protein [Phytoactinopolyspora halophila]AYY12602.1 DUF397 domain-containing protein [Actinobacteria bacterium YIM 96077]RAW12495.1 hypothetical protein DPM12_13925 [Phytoactinopolyspora halophila]
MDEVFNGMSAADVPHAVWRKSTRSGAQGNCVELAQLPTGTIALRNSHDPDGPALIFTHDELAAFVAGAKAGEFDLPEPHETSQGRTPAQLDTSTKDHHGGTPSRYQVINAELQNLTNQLLAGDTVLDRESSERLVRILSGVALLHRMHRVDRNGNCTICRTKSRRWHPTSRHDVCSVYAALSLYLGRSLMASAEPHEMAELSGHSALGPTRRSW